MRRFVPQRILRLKIMDWYLEQPDRLKGQPKRTIGDYVESQGILVPRRFDNLKEARGLGLPVIVRSEHTQDYDGSSGLLKSPKLENFQGVQSEEELKEAILKRSDKPLNLGDRLIELHCNYLQQDYAEFRRNVSYSFWEFIQGDNLKIVADSAISDRYHITSSGEGLDEEVSYSVFDLGKGVSFSTGNKPESLSFERLIEDYEKIRRAPNFESSNCPLMEFQLSEGKNYFLQYMRTAPFAPATFELSPEPREGWVKSFFVRGATPKEGRVLRVNAYYGSKMEMDLTRFNEDASLDMHWDRVFSEIMVRKRKAQFMHTKGWLTGELAKIATGHNAASKLFKPQVSIYTNIYNHLTKEELRGLYEKSEERNSAEGVDIHLVSDGKLAFTKRV